MGWAKGDPGFDLLSSAGARASQEGLRMNRRFGLGDIVTIISIVVYFSCMVFYFARYWQSSGFDAVAFGQIILILLVGMPITFMVLSFRNERYLNLQYAFTGFIILLKLAQVSVLKDRGEAAGMDFFILLGALGVGIGAYLSHVGIGEMHLRAPDEAPAANVTVEDRLRELTRLKDGGLITEQEFGKKREEILGDLP